MKTQQLLHEVDCKCSCFVHNWGMVWTAAETLVKGARKARAAMSNRSGRFEQLSQETVLDDWGLDADTDPHTIRTEVRIEQARTALSWNTSPDLPFDRSVNPYRGCEHGCVYCFARPSHAFLGMSPGLDFETRLVARPNIANALRQDIAKPSYRVAPIALGTNTDPYQPVERDLKITHSVLLTLEEARHPVAIVTKGALIEQDSDILERMAAEGLARVGISITTLDAGLSRKMEPRAPLPARRLEIIRRLSERGIPVRVMVSPIVPGLTDPELEAILSAAKQAGATSSSWIMLRLPREVSEIWQEWLRAEFPDRAEKVMNRLREMHGGKDYDSEWHRRMRGQGRYAEMIAARFRLASQRLGFKEPPQPLRTDLFRRPQADGRQMSFF